jgi:hypothetical protein
MEKVAAIGNRRKHSPMDSNSNAENRAFQPSVLPTSCCACTFNL